jgi:hypothetical protein
MFNGNDWRDTYLGLHKHQVVEGAVELDQENLRRKLPRADRERQPFALPRASDPWRLRRLLTRFATFRLVFGAAGRENPWLEFRPSPYFTSFSYWCQYPYPEVARHARRVTLATLDRLREQSSRIGATLALACIPAREQVYSVDVSGSYFDISRPQVFAQKWAAQHAVPFLDLLPVLRQQASTSHAPLFLGSDIHLNTRGHRVVGEQLVTWFRGFAERKLAAHEEPR